MRNRAGLVAGTGAAAIATATLLSQTVLPSLGLREAITICLTVAAGLLVALIAALGAQENSRAAERERDALLDAGHACWPPRAVSELSPYELGAHPTGEHPPPAGEDAGEADADRAPAVLPAYVPRSADEALRAALADSDAVVVVYGPPRAGKTRSAYEALRARHPDARLLVPEDADGLTTALAHADDLQDLARKPLVLWLDDVDRFLPGLDLDVLDRLAAAKRPVRLVATIAEERLEALLDEPEEGEPHPDGRRARRLLARARAIRVPTPIGAEAAAADAAAGTTTLRSRLPEGWWPTPRAAVRRPGRDLRPSMPVIGLLVALVSVLGGAGIYAHQKGLDQPADIAQQVADLQDGPACEDAAVSPADVKELDDDTIVALAVHRSICGRPDELRLYRRVDDRMRHLTTLRLPADGPRRTLACVGEDTSDPCAVDVERAGRILIGTFDDPTTRQAHPFAVNPGDDGLNLVSLSLRAPRTGRGLDRATLQQNRRALALRLDGGEQPAACAPRTQCVKTHGAQAWAAFSQRREWPAVLVAGHLARGSTPEAPRVLHMRAWRIVGEAGRPQVRERCWIFTRGIRVPLVAEVSSGAEASSDLADRWRALLKPRDSAVVC
jgi:hypothetical protein